MGTSEKKVLVLAGDTDGNLGDRAIVYSTCQELRSLNPGIQITIVSGNPELDRSYFNVRAIPRGPRGFIPLIRAARNSDVVLCGGGGLFQDDASLVKMPYWALRLALVRCFTRKIVGYSLGVGPLDWASSRLAARLAFSCMQQVSVRDPLARAVSEPLTSKPIRVIPDPALLLPPATEQEADRVLEQAGVPKNRLPLVGVAVRRWFHHRPTLVPHKYAVKYRLRRIPGQTECNRLISLLAQVLDRLVEEQEAFIIFLPTYNVPHEADDDICDAVRNRMTSDRARLVRIPDPRVYKAVASRLRLMLAGRMHAAIFAAAVGTPVVGLSYNQKFTGFFDLIGCEGQLIEVEEFVNKQLTGKLLQLLAQADGLGPTISQRARALAAQTRHFTTTILDPAQSDSSEARAV